MVTPALLTICRREASAKPFSRNSSIAACWMRVRVSLCPSMAHLAYNSVIYHCYRIADRVEFVKTFLFLELYVDHEPVPSTHAKASRQAAEKGKSQFLLFHLRSFSPPRHKFQRLFPGSGRHFGFHCDGSPVKQPLLFIRLLRHRRDLIARGPDGRAQRGLVNVAIREDHSLPFAVRGSDLLHRECLSDGIVHMGLAHPAHHSVHLYCDFQHCNLLLFSIQAPHPAPA